MNRTFSVLGISLLLASSAAIAAGEANAPPDVRGQFRYASTAVRFDVSPPLRSMAIIPPADLSGSVFFGSLMIDPDPFPKMSYGEQDADRAVQGVMGALGGIPAPSTTFDGGSGSANPPDPVGDVGPNHYVRMSNASFQVFTKTGVSVFGPANINTLWQGFGGDCEIENAGDPIVVYDQAADRWLLSQFSNSSGPGFFNCVALSTTSDPAGTYFRWAFPASAFPDYPKYGIWPNAYVITTRELDVNSIGVYAIDRQQMIAGNPTPTIVSFLNPLNEGVAQFVGDGLLPADLDGATPPPAGSPVYLVGSMDDGGPYGSILDALSLWRLTLDFATPTQSTLVLASVIPIADYDTIFPCTGRSCIPQPAPLGAVDILSYRQRPTMRAAYRNYGSYESIVTNQSVEAAAGLGGIRWWEIRNPAGTPILYQDSTYAPGVTDGIHRWMGSIAADSSGNMALGYSASGTSSFPSVRYTGRLEADPLGTMPQGEGVFQQGDGGLTATTRRWGDYTSMNVDSSDDCTFWYVNEYFATSGTVWTLKVGSFRFPDCGTPSYGLAAVPLRQAVCTPADAVITVDAHGYNGFAGSAALLASGNPAGTTATFATNPLATVPGSTTLTIGNTAAAGPGTYPITVTSEAGLPPVQRSRTVDVTLFTAVPDAPALISPADLADTGVNPVLSWAASAQGTTYQVEVATDAAFANIVFTGPSSDATSQQLPLLQFGTQYFWRVRSGNTCGDGAYSAVRSFITRPAPGLCRAGEAVTTLFADAMESGTNGWTTDPASGTTWTQSTARPFSGTRAWLAVDIATASDQRLISPSVALPAAADLLALRFQHDVTIEENGPAACWDGGFVEISTDDGVSWNALPPATVIETAYYGPLPSGQPAYCGNFRYRQSTLELDAFAGQTVRFRFRNQTDTSVGNVPHGWYIDDVQVIGCETSERIFRDGFENL